MDNQLNTYWNDLKTIQGNLAKAKLELLNFERELQETEFYKMIVEKRKEVEFLEKKETETKTQIVNWMLAYHVKSLEFENQKFTVKKNPWSLVIHNADLIPEEFKKEKTELVIDKKAIKEKITNGEIIDGCEITNSYSLIITDRNGN